MANNAAFGEPYSNDVDEAAVARFATLTGCPSQQARFYLDATGGNFDRAVAVYFEQEAPTQHHTARAQPPASGTGRTPPRPRAPGAPQPAGGGSGNVLQFMAAVPVRLLRTGLHLVFGALHVGLTVVHFLGTRYLPSPVLHRLQGVADAVARGSTEVEPATAASEFVRQFAAEHGDVRPRWVESGWQAATAQAHAGYKFLFVYLHSPAHEDTQRFCGDTLCSPEVVEYLNSNFVCWGGDVRFSDAFRLAASLRVATYPFVALLAFSGARTQLTVPLQGCWGPAELIEALQRGVNDNGAQLVAEQAEQQERDFNRRLREEQDAEYQRSLEADRQREAQAQEQRAAQEAAARAAADAQAAARAAKEAEERRAAELEAALQQRKAAKRGALKPEPEAGAAGVTLVRVRLPDGSNSQRRFQGSDCLQDVYDFVDSLESLGSLRYALASNFPRKVYTNDLLQTDLQSLGLMPQALLFVQPDDD